MDYDTEFTFFTGDTIQCSNHVLTLRTVYDDTDYPVYYEVACFDNTNSKCFYGNKFDTLEDAFNDFQHVILESYFNEI